MPVPPPVITAIFPAKSFMETAHLFRRQCFEILVGARGFEPPTPWSPQENLSAFDCTMRFSQTWVLQEQIRKPLSQYYDFVKVPVGRLRAYSLRYRLPFEVMPRFPARAPSKAAVPERSIHSQVMFVLFSSIT